MRFTFHYELIITASSNDIIFFFLRFTFHYELIITIQLAKSAWILISFTFHYELIITKVMSTIWRWPKKIYISLWTNYNALHTIYLYNFETFTFHYELIITTRKGMTEFHTAKFTFHYELIITLSDSWC